MLHVSSQNQLLDAENQITVCFNLENTTYKRNPSTKQPQNTCAPFLLSSSTIWTSEQSKCILLVEITGGNTGLNKSLAGKKVKKKGNKENKGGAPHLCHGKNAVLDELSYCLVTDLVKSLAGLKRKVISR